MNPRTNLITAVVKTRTALVTSGILTPEQIGLKTVAFYERSLWKATREFYNGDIDASGFIGHLIYLIEEQTRRAWNEGMRNVGLNPSKDMTPEYEAVLRGVIDSEFNHVLDFAAAIQKAKEDGKDIAPFQSRVQLWANRYNEVVNLSEITCKPKELFEWVYGDTQHCSTCAALNGVVATGEQWQASRYRPQSPPNPFLECGGWRCQCRLVPTKKPATAGGIPWF